MTERASEKRAILVLSIGTRDFLPVTMPSIEDYARKIGADLIVERESSLDWLLRLRVAMVRRGRRHLAAYVQKVISLERALARYDRVLLLDDSCLVNPAAPDLFALVPKGRLAAYPESEHDEYQSHRRDRAFIRKRRGVEVGDYFNTGVLLADRSLRGLFSWASVFRHVTLFGSAYADQGYVNYMISAREVDVFRLPESWNFSPIESYGDPAGREAERLSDAYLATVARTNIVHVTGYFRARMGIVSQIAAAMKRAAEERERAVV